MFAKGWDAELSPSCTPTMLSHMFTVFSPGLPCTGALSAVRSVGEWVGSVLLSYFCCKSLSHSLCQAILTSPNPNMPVLWVKGASHHYWYVPFRNRCTHACCSLSLPFPPPLEGTLQPLFFSVGVFQDPPFAPH